MGSESADGASSPRLPGLAACARLFEVRRLVSALLVILAVFGLSVPRAHVVHAHDDGHDPHAHHSRQGAHVPLHGPHRHAAREAASDEAPGHSHDGSEPGSREDGEPEPHAHGTQAHDAVARVRADRTAHDGHDGHVGASGELVAGIAPWAALAAPAADGLRRAHGRGARRSDSRSLDRLAVSGRLLI